MQLRILKLLFLVTNAEAAAKLTDDLFEKKCLRDWGRATAKRREPYSGLAWAGKMSAWATFLL